MNNLLHEVNEYFNILDYKKFYNDSLSKHLNIKREFRTYFMGIKDGYKGKQVF